jgi:O-succinylbenzoic acid--CoA ligase
MKTGLHLNDVWYDTRDLLKYCEGKLSEAQCPTWERDIANFIIEWHNEKSFIEVQTSGSTGQPKLYQIKKEFVINSASMTLEFLGLKPENTALLCLPVNFIAGKMMIVRAILGNLHITAVEPRGNIADDLLKEIDFAAMVPLQVQVLMESPNGLAKIALIKNLIIGGAPIHPLLEENLKHLTQLVYSTYGMTETISHIAMRRLDGAGYSKFYKLLPNISINKDENDCLIINAPKLSERPLITKDVVQITQPNEFEVLGRADNMIISGGIKHFPENIEKKLAGVFDDRFIISSKPDLKLGEKIILILETQQPEKYKTNYLNNIFSSRLAEFETPKKVFFVDRFFETGTSKLVRKAITMQALEFK